MNMLESARDRCVTDVRRMSCEEPVILRMEMEMEMGTEMMLDGGCRGA